MKKPIKIFLDSGAYSAKTQNVKIDLDSYIKFICKYKDRLEVYAVLDVIGDPEATFDNQIRMERAGLRPIPCFHYGEDVKWLEKYLDRGHDYIALGGMVGLTSSSSLFPWLDYLFSTRLTDSSGMPRVKVHGFGMTSFDVMLRYPWYSVDSTSWIITGRTGAIFVPAIRGRELVYDQAPFIVTVSSRSPNSASNPDHISCLPKRVKEIVLNYIHSKGCELGMSEWIEVPSSYELQDGERWNEKKAERERRGKGKIERRVVIGVSNDYRKRDEMNIAYFADLEKSMPQWPWPFRMKRRIGFRL